MGRVKTKLIKRMTNKLMDQHSDKFKKTFEENKKIVEKYMDFSSKKFRNVIAGYVTRMMKKQELTASKQQKHI